MDAWILYHLQNLAEALVLLAAGTGLVLYIVRRDDKHKHENYDSSKNRHRSFE